MLLEQNLTNDNSEFFYKIIQEQNEDMVKYCIDKNFVNMDKTSLIWTTILCMKKKYYSQMYSYGSKKILALVYNLINDFSNSYDGHVIDDMFYDNPSYFTS